MTLKKLEVEFFAGHAKARRAFEDGDAEDDNAKVEANVKFTHTQGYKQVWRAHMRQAGYRVIETVELENRAPCYTCANLKKDTEFEEGKENRPLAPDEYCYDLERLPELSMRQCMACWIKTVDRESVENEQRWLSTKLGPVVLCSECGNGVRTKPVYNHRQDNGAKCDTCWEPEEQQWKEAEERTARLKKDAELYLQHMKDMDRDSDLDEDIDDARWETEPTPPPPSILRTELGMQKWRFTEQAELEDDEKEDGEAAITSNDEGRGNVDVRDTAEG